MNVDFVDELQCGESCENIPFEFHRLSVNCVQKFCIVVNSLNQLNFSSQAEFHVGFTFIFPRHNTESENT